MFHVHRTFAFLLLLLSFSAPQTIKAQKQLNLFIWSEYIDPAVLKDFEAQHKVRVVVDLYEDSESMLAKLKAGGSSAYDVVVPPDHIVPTLIRQKLIARLSKAPGGLTNLNSRFINPPYDPQNQFTIPYMWGTVGILARSSTPLEPTWKLLFDPQKQLGPIVFLDSMRDTIGAALKSKGFSLNSTTESELKEAAQILAAVKKKVVSFDGSVGARNKVLARQAVAAIVYSGEAAKAIEEQKDLQFLVPTEGSQLWVDNLAVTSGSKNKELAETFIAFLLQPEVAARNAAFTQFATPNESAKKLLKPEQLKNAVIYPPDEVMGRLEFLKDLGAKTRLYDELWTRVKNR